jgi:hypothetical protein
MHISFITNEKGVIAPIDSVQFTMTFSEGLTAFVSGVKYHPVDPRSLVTHDSADLPKAVAEITEKSRLAGYKQP